MDSSVRISPGINVSLLEALKQEVQFWKKKDKYCSIIFDEMSLPPGLKFDKKDDVINGFADLGKKTNKFADHALTFMIRGASDNNLSRLIAFYFSEGPIKTNELKAILKKIVQAVVDIGLKPVVLICYEKESFQSVLESLMEDTRQACNKLDGVISLSGQNLSVIYDPFHLLKEIRNAFITNNILLDGNISKWDDIVDVYKRDCRSKAYILSELKSCHVFPNKINKKKMETCPLLSNKVAGLLSYTSKFGLANSGISATMANTAATVAFFENLLDSCKCNGCELRTSKLKKMRRAVNNCSEHHTFWEEAVQKLENMRFIDKNGEIIELSCLKSWITTVKSLQRLWDFFKSKKITTMRPAYFNCTHIDFFFNDVRLYYHDNNSACNEFIQNYISRLPYELGSDYLSPPIRRDCVRMHSNAYILGWLVKKILSIIECSDCQNSNSLTIQGYGSHRESKLFQENKLNHPSKHAMRYFNIIEKETYRYLDNKPYEDNISKNIMENILHRFSFNFPTCYIHKEFVRKYFITFLIRLCICNWCNMINNIMKGTISNVNSSNGIMQQKAVKKYKQGLRNKNVLKYLFFYLF